MPCHSKPNTKGPQVKDYRPDEILETGKKQVDVLLVSWVTASARAAACIKESKKQYLFPQLWHPDSRCWVEQPLRHQVTLPFPPKAKLSTRASGA